MKQHAFRLLLAGLLGTFAAVLNAIAVEISAEQAADAVQAWIDEEASLGYLSGGEVVSSDTATVPKSGARLHVVKLTGGGFVVTSTDDLVNPVLAFSPTGNDLVQDNANPLWVLLAGDIAAREAAAGVVRGGATTRGIRSTASAPTPAQKRWADLLERAAALKNPSSNASRPRSRAAVAALSDVWVEPFVASLWNQGTHNNYSSGSPCYNYYTPNNYVCGCVATAGAQLMRYWQWPQTPVTPATRNCRVNGSTVSMTMIGDTYDWDSMPLVPANGVTEAQRQAIGKLTYDIGVSVGMDWGPRGSSSNPFGLVLRFVDTFGFANALAALFDEGHPFTLEEFQAIVIPNCDVRAPLVMGVDGDPGGHAVVVDGYGWSGGDFCVHVNCGWGGSGDAWYIPPDIEEFDVIDQLVFNVFPEATGSILSGRVLDASGAPVSGASVVLSRNSSTVDTAVSDMNGIYAFVAAPGSYVVTAAKGGVSASLGASASASTGVSLVPDGTGSWYLNSYASIGNSWGNDIALTGMEATPAPVFSPDSCLFYPSTNVTITCADAGATIRYTLDDSAPTETSTVYTGLILVDDTVTIRARAFSTGKNPSPIVAATFTYDAAQGAPKGDYFADPIAISGASGTRVIDDNSAYTVEAGEPWHTLRPSEGGYTYNHQYRTVWYRWTAPGSGTMTFQTSCAGGGFLYPTYIAVYTGDSLSQDNRLAVAYEYDQSTYVTTLNLSVEQGTTYRIVGMLGYDGAGAFTLQWSGDLTAARSPYETWADGKVVGGPEAVTGGIANAFRYVFNRPTGSFSTISSITFDASGHPVLTFPTFVNTNGVTLSVLSTTNLADWTSSAVREVPLAVDQTGAQTLSDTTPTRFYRLKVVVE